MYVLHSLHLQPSDFQSFIFILKADNDLEFLISAGTNSQVLGPLYLMVSKPLFIVLTFGNTHSWFPRVEGMNSS